MRKKILLVEDSLHDAEFTLHALKHCSIDNPVVLAEDGAVGLAHLVNDSEIALVMLDLKMRIVDGFEFLKIARNDSRFASLPILVVSTSILPVDRTRTELLGASGYIVKEFDLRQFSDSICAALAPFHSELGHA